MNRLERRLTRRLVREGKRPEQKKRKMPVITSHMPAASPLRIITKEFILHPTKGWRWRRLSEERLAL